MRERDARTRGRSPTPPGSSTGRNSVPQTALARLVGVLWAGGRKAEEKQVEAPGIECRSLGTRGRSREDIAGHMGARDSPRAPIESPLRPQLVGAVTAVLHLQRGPTSRVGSAATRRTQVEALDVLRVHEALGLDVPLPG